MPGSGSPGPGFISLPMYWMTSSDKGAGSTCSARAAQGTRARHRLAIDKTECKRIAIILTDLLRPPDWRGLPLMFFSCCFSDALLGHSFGHVGFLVGWLVRPGCVRAGIRFSGRIDGCLVRRPFHVEGFMGTNHPDGGGPFRFILVRQDLQGNHAGRGIVQFMACGCAVQGQGAHLMAGAGGP